MDIVGISGSLEHRWYNIAIVTKTMMIMLMIEKSSLKLNEYRSLKMSPVGYAES